MAYLDSVAETEATSLSKYAKKSIDCVGRKTYLTPDPNRTEFERDTHRILHSWPFRRLRNKAQVFYAPKNDHLCTRLEHALHVASISKTICKHLKLNCDLAEAISLAHDLGHPPFGHIGETILRGLHKNNHLPVFKHEAQSLHVIDRFMHNGEALNLTYEVRDGVVCHCGEKIAQQISPNRKKDIFSVEPSAAKRQRPATLEGCVVRFSDIISYLGRDYEDAITVGITRKKLPPEVTRVLGDANREIIRKLIYDIVQNSKDTDAVIFSDEVYSAVKSLYKFNIDNIYENKIITGQIDRIEQMLYDIFYLFSEVVKDSKRGKSKPRRYHGEAIETFYEFLDDMRYSPQESDAQIVSDFVAGMTDIYATRVYQEMFLVSPPV
jgi:dGTPase